AGGAVSVQRVPDRRRDAEGALATDARRDLEVLGPVAVAEPHEIRVPAALAALRDQRLLLVEAAHEPLPRRHELERALALLVELDAVLDGLRLAAERAAAQQLDDRLARPRDRLAAQPGVVAGRPVPGGALPPPPPPRS